MALAPDFMDIAGRLIGFDTTSRNSNLDLIDYAEKMLRAAGARTRLSRGVEGNKANLFATLGPELDGGYVLSGHTDVVPVDGQEWASDPFRTDLREEKLFGRGTCDMKGFIAVALSLVPEFRRHDLKRPIHFAFSYDEEVGCVGVRALLADLGDYGIKPALVIVGEPTEMKVVGAHKGGAVIDTVIKGRDAHSSNPAKGASAVMMAGEFIAGLGMIGEDLRADRDDHFDPPYSTLQANMVGGGTAVNVLARDAHVTWEYRCLPDRDPQKITQRVFAHAEQVILPRYRSGAPEAAFHHHMHASYPGLARDPHSPAVRLACQLSGGNDVHVVPYGTEAGLFQQAGIPAVVCGPGSVAQAHRENEFVTLEQLERCTEFLRRVGQAASV